MTKNLATFRLRMLAAIQTARVRWPGAKLYLLYAPGYADPLGLAKGDDPPKRNTALIPWGTDTIYEKPNFPRVIEFDCRRIAPYLLETDPAFDDPLLEDTFALALKELQTAAPDPDHDEGTGRAHCGWLISPDSAPDIAQRFVSASQRKDATQPHRSWLRWHDPRMMALLWPHMTAEQKAALLGRQLTWLAFDAAGHLVEFSPESVDDEAARSLNLTPSQWPAVHHLGLVNQLVELWRQQRGEPLPRNATEAVHREVVRALAWGLDGRDVQVLVLMALKLRQGFEEDADLLEIVHDAARNPGTLFDRIQDLPAAFWERHGAGP